jgi:serine/threonine protein kinase
MNQIRSYELLNLLGPQGKYCKTYLAHNHDLPSVPYCVVKELSQPSFPKVLELFKREAKVLDRLGKHSHIPQLIASFAEGDYFYLVQEYIDGQDLSHEIASGQVLRDSQVRDILRQVLTILTFVHEQGVIHRDISPKNLIRHTESREIYLIDFGSVKEISASKRNVLGQIRTPTLVGTPGYTAPEQQRGKPCFASDLYSLGMVAVAALTGVEPHTLLTDPKNGNVIWTDRLRRRPDDPALIQFIDRLVAHHPQHRPTSARIALEEFEQALGAGRSAAFARPLDVATPDDPVPTDDCAPTDVVAPRNPDSVTTDVDPDLPWDSLFKYSIRGSAVLIALATVWGLGGMAKRRIEWWWYFRQQPPAVQPRYLEAHESNLECLFDWDNCQVRLHEQAFKPYWAMTTAAQADGVFFWCESGFQSIEQQTNIFDQQSEAALARALNESDYHTGFAVVLSLQAPEDRRPTSRREFERSTVFRWLQDNAADYGFALSYPQGDPNYEPWRWRYVGPGSVFSTP